jgi:hypothetical protein
MSERMMQFRFTMTEFEEGKPESCDHQVVMEFNVPDNAPHDKVRSRFFEFLNGCGYVIRDFKSLGDEPR